MNREFTELAAGLAEKRAALMDVLREMGPLVIAFSGGVDSSYLLKVAAEALQPSQVLAVTVTSPLNSSWEEDRARRLVAAQGVQHLLVEGNELQNEAFLANSPDRCYICKFDRFGELVRIARERGYRHVADGGNADDVSDYRPGLRAAEELGVRSPLREVGLTKAEIRTLSRIEGLETWNHPSRACLASRFPYGEPITREGLARVDRSERLLLDAGFIDVRVRSHGPLARIEVPVAEFERLLSCREEIVRQFKEFGFVYVTLDLAGFRSGSMNEVL